jgi:3-hydroxyacyl-[acyl-carrier-protein] dehydratase
MSPIECGLPHRAPFIFIDEVTEVNPGESASAVKTFQPDEPFFQGHFPGDPLVPGVILTEAMAQTAGIAAGQPGRTFHLAALKMVKFLRPVRPSDRIEFFAKKLAEAGGLVQFQATATVAGTPVCEGVLILSAVG